MTQLSSDAPLGAMPEAQRAELAERAAALRPLLSKNAAETERQRRVAEENIEAITDAGLFRLFVPQRFGGHQADMRTQLAVSSQLGQGCGSTAWTTALLNIHSWLIGLFPERAQDDVFSAGADTRCACVPAPSAQSRRVDGGLVVSGRWAFASGCLHAQWAMGGVPITADDGHAQDHVLALMPMSDLAIEDTWFVAGMRGTGSNTIVAEDVFVPDHRCMSLPAAIHGDYPTEYKDEPLYRSALTPVLLVSLLGPQIGMARAALEFVLEKAPRRGITYTHFEKQTDSVGFQIDVATAASKLDSAHLHAHRAATDIDDAAARGEYLEFKTRARVRMDAARAAQLCGEAIDTLVSAHGASSFAEQSPLQRIWRDQGTARRHALLGGALNEEVYGKALLGVEPNVTDLI